MIPKTNPYLCILAVCNTHRIRPWYLTDLMGVAGQLAKRHILPHKTHLWRFQTIHEGERVVPLARHALACPESTPMAPACDTRPCTAPTELKLAAGQDKDGQVSVWKGCHRKRYACRAVAASGFDRQFWLAAATGGAVSHLLHPFSQLVLIFSAAIENT